MTAKRTAIRSRLMSVALSEMTTFRGHSVAAHFRAAMAVKQRVERMLSVWGFDFGFGDFFGDLGGCGELGAVPAAAERFD